MNVKELNEIEPCFNTVILTADKKGKQVVKPVYSVYDTEGTLEEYQTVVAVGKSVRNCEKNDIVKFNPNRYAVYKHLPGSVQENVQKDNPVLSYNIPTISLNGKEYLKVCDSDIDFVVNKCTYVEKGIEKSYTKKKKKEEK